MNTGLEIDRKTRTGNLSTGFSFFTGSMVLSFAAIESFSASVAFLMSSDQRFPMFDFESYRKAQRFWDKMSLLMTAVGLKIDKGNGLFQQIGQMQKWRNLVAHASPYEIEPIEISDTIKAPAKLHARQTHLDYTRSADADNAKNFYTTACTYIDLVSEKTGIDPRASVTYKSQE